MECTVLAHVVVPWPKQFPIAFRKFLGFNIEFHKTVPLKDHPLNIGESSGLSPDLLLVHDLNHELMEIAVFSFCHVS